MDAAEHWPDFGCGSDEEQVIVGADDGDEQAVSGADVGDGLAFAEADADSDGLAFAETDGGDGDGPAGADNGPSRWWLPAKLVQQPVLAEFAGPPRPLSPWAAADDGQPPTLVIRYTDSWGLRPDLREARRLMAAVLAAVGASGSPEHDPDETRLVGRLPPGAGARALAVLRAESARLGYELL